MSGGVDPPGSIGGYDERMLLSLSLAWFAVVTGRLLLPPLLPTIIADLGLSFATAGIMLTGLQAATATVLYPAGRLSDGLGRASIVVPGLAVFAVGLVLVAGAPFYLAMLAGAVTMGIGNGLFAISSRALISDRFVERRGRALGVFAAGFNVGGILASAIAAVTLATWRTPFVAIAGLIGLVTLLFVRWNREPYAIGWVNVGLLDTGRRLLGRGDLRRPLVAYSLFFVVTQSFLGFFPTFLQEVKGLTPVLASAGFALVFAVGAVSKVIAGGLSDRVPRRNVALASVLLAAVGLGWLLVADGLVGVALGTIVFAVGHQAQFPLVDAILMDAVPDGSLGGDLGAARTVFRFVGSLGPAYVGLVALQFGLAAAFAGLVVALVGIAALLASGAYAASRA